MLKADEEITIDDTHILLGSGTIEAPTIVIEVNRFNFTGKIVCENECKISTVHIVDPSLFTMQGSGTFNFIVKKIIDDEGNEY
ncbi:MAG: hypothetical protein BWY54_00711 [Candidatus Dependentiae bacterium ADurb.Bin331]|nr:MAG: hypothetical protein BWY54_00711 [Candidatus Dependentiae bacterium ADurb.Bin331]